MRDFLKKPYVFGIIYSIFLTLATGYVLLDTFVIPENIKTSTSLKDTVSDGNSSKGKYSDKTYKDNNISISIEETRKDDTTIYVVDVQLSDILQLKTAFADNTYGRNIKDTTSEMAESNNAILAINGDYYGFRKSGYVLRNGTLYRNVSNNNEDLAIMADGTFKIFNEISLKAEDLEKEGALQIFSFGPSLVNEGKISVDKNEEVSNAMRSNPRTAIGMISPLHYKIIVADGRTKDSIGLTLYQLAELFKEQGCSTAYNLDGGGSTTLWFNGKVINNPTDGRSMKEREVSDIVYIGY